ncbi:MAG: hypothetical protein ACPG7F_11895 [Aggregatilineales bacterium]
MDGIVDSSALANLPAQVVAAVQGTLILFAIGAPFLGWLLSRATEKLANFLLAWSTALFVLLAGNFGFNLLLRELIAKDFLADVWVSVLSMALILPITVLLTRFIIWYLADPEPPAWMQNYDTMDESKLLPFERRRQEHMARKRRAQRR